MIVIKIIFWTSLTVIVSGDLDDESFASIKTCLGSAYVDDVNNIKDISDIEIASSGHMSGLRPESYEISLRFDNQDQFTGSINISVRVVQNTNRLAIHMNKRLLRYDLENTVIHQNCSNDCWSNCFRIFGYNSDRNVVVFYLRKELPKDLTLILEFRSFAGNVYKDMDPNGSPGLHRSGDDYFWAIHTYFLAKHASTVFPCFDHPALKARFRLCLQYPKTYTVACSAPSSENASLIESDFLQQCFEYTPIIPVYVLSFAVMNFYEKMDIDDDSMPISIYVPMAMQPRFKGLGAKVLTTLENVRKIFQDDVYFPSVSLLMLYEAGQYLAVENAGLILIDGEKAEDLHWDQSLGGEFHRSLVHQWIGAKFTVSHWGAICLQQGLSQYIQWLLWDEQEGRDLKTTIRNVSGQFTYFQQPPMSHFMGSYPANYQPDCEHRAAMVFHMIAEVYDVDAVKTFATRLAKSIGNGNANLQQWDEILVQSISEPDLNGYMEAWFTQFTPITLKIVRFNEAVIIDQATSIGHRSYYPLPIGICIDDCRSSTFHVMNTVSSIFLLPETPKWVVVDPNLVTLTRKLYSSDLYSDTFATLLAMEVKCLKPKWRQNYVEEFCRALLSNSLPLQGDISVVTWKQVFRQAFSLNASCRCCLVSASERNQSICNTRIFSQCGRVDLVVRLNYSVPVTARFFDYFM